MWINFNCMNLSMSGGNRFIFELSNALVERGYEVTLTHAGEPEYTRWFNPVRAKIIQCELPKSTRLLNKIHHVDLLKRQQQQLIKYSPSCDVNVATFWTTAQPTIQSNKGRPFYLVQHYEPSFYPVDSIQFREAKATYELPLTKLCVSKWLTDLVQGINIGNGINLHKYKRHDIKRIPRSVFVSYRNIAWKNPTLTKMACDRLMLDGFNVLSSDGLMSDDDMVKMYNEAEVYLNLSEKEGFGYGPLEAMNCGCKVVSTSCAEYLRHLRNAVIVQPNVDDAVLWVKCASMGLDWLVEEGYRTAGQFSFDGVVDRFVAAVSVDK